MSISQGLQHNVFVLCFIFVLLMGSLPNLFPVSVIKSLIVGDPTNVQKLG